MQFDLLTLLAQAVFVVLFLRAVAEAARNRSPEQLDIAALFGTLAGVVLIAGLGLLVGRNAVFTYLSLFFLVSHPYALVRLLSHFGSTALMHRLSLAGMLLCWLLIAVSLTLPPEALTPIAIALGVLFLVGSIHAAVSFYLLSRRSGAMTRPRVIAVSLAAACLTGTLLTAVLAAPAPAWLSPVLTQVSRLLALCMAIAYVVAFAPPTWLRRSWQMAEVQRFLKGDEELGVEARLREALDSVGPAAVRAVGGKTGVLALLDTTVRTPLPALRAHRPSGEPSAEIEVSPQQAPFLSKALAGKEPVLALNPALWGSALQQLAREAEGAGAAIIAPVRAGGQTYGVLVLFFERSPLFPEDASAILPLLTQHVAESIQVSQHLQERQRQARQQQVLVDLSHEMAVSNNVGAVVTGVEGVLSQLDVLGSWNIVMSRNPLDLLRFESGGEIASTSPELLSVPAVGSAADEALTRGTTAVRERGNATAAEVAVPMLFHGASIGVIGLTSDRVEMFRPEEIHLVDLVASQTALALSRAAAQEGLSTAKETAEAANRQKSEFLANMSHELRTPLNSILGFSELMMDDPDLYDEETRTTYLSTIHSSGRHLLALINDILDLSKVEAGRMDLRLERVDISALVSQVLSTIQPLAQAKSLTVRADDNTSTAASLDPGKVKQILYNLLSNAIKFTPDGGSVSLSLTESDEWLTIVVTDTGVGIAPEDQERVFEEFRQLDAGPGRQHEGTGLGLSLTRRLAELHGGDIQLTSTPGVGSSFTVQLPLVRDAESDAVIDDASLFIAPHVAANATLPLVLVVEDDSRAANLLSQYLAKGGYRTEVATDGLSALEKASLLNPVAITLDVMLPALDGWEVLRSLKQDPATRDIPVVVVSAIDDHQFGYALGAVDYFVKPIDREALLARLDRYRFTSGEASRRIGRVLVADDDPRATELMAATLQPLGLEILIANGGEEAIRLAREEHPDLLLLDLMMPLVSGFEVVSELQQDAGTRDIPILVITAKDLTAEDKQQLNGHVAAIMQKGTFGSVELLGWLGDLEQRMLPRPNPEIASLPVADPA